MSYQQVLALFNRTNIVHCLLACSVFGKALQRSFKPLFCMVSKLFWRKILLLQGQQKVNFSEGQPTLVMSHFFLVGATNIISGLIQPLLKLLNFVLKQKPHILQSSEVPGSFGFLPLSQAGIGFVSGIIPFPHFWSSRKHYIAWGNLRSGSIFVALWKLHSGGQGETKRF